MIETDEKIIEKKEETKKELQIKTEVKEGNEKKSEKKLLATEPQEPKVTQRRQDD